MGAGVGAVLVTESMNLHYTLTYITVYNEYQAYIVLLQSFHALVFATHFYFITSI